MSKAAMIRRALLAGGAMSAIGAGNAAAKSRDEDRSAFDKRTGGQQLDYAGTQAFRERMSTLAHGVWATRSLAAGTAPDAVKRVNGAVVDRVRNGEPTRLGDYRSVLDAYAAINPGEAAEMRTQLARFEPKRDRDVDERPGAALGAVGGALAGLVATRGRGGGARRLVKKALTAGGFGAAGAGLGAAAANANSATLSGDDAGDIGKMAAAGAGVGIAALGARAGVKRLARNAVVRGVRIRQATPAIDAATPAMDARDLERAGRTVAKRGVKWFEKDSDILAADILHMERTLERAGMKRRFTTLDDQKAIARKIDREGGWDAMQDGLDALERDYRAALSRLRVKQGGAPSLNRAAPEVTDPREREAIEAGVEKGVAARNRRSVAARQRRQRTGNANPLSAVKRQKPKGPRT